MHKEKALWKGMLHRMGDLGEELIRAFYLEEPESVAWIRPHFPKELEKKKGPQIEAP